jgi:hypothetical protein
MVLGLFGVGYCLAASEPRVDFEQANRLLDQGKAGEAVSIYEKLLGQGTSAALENTAALYERHNALRGVTPRRMISQISSGLKESPSSITWFGNVG